MLEKINDVKSYEDFKKVYNLFRGYPFYEDWNEIDFREEYDFIKENGIMFGIYKKWNNIKFYEKAPLKKYYF